MLEDFTKEFSECLDKVRGEIGEGKKHVSLHSLPINNCQGIFECKIISAGINVRSLRKPKRGSPEFWKINVA